MSGRRSPPVFTAIVALAIALSAAPADAEGFLEFLFGKMGGKSEQASAPESATPASRPLSLTVRPHVAGLGGGIAFCVRMCDGRYFPIQRSVNVQPAQICNSLCPASKTKVFAGPDISRAVAADGGRYSALDTAFLYRQETVDDCTCNGVTAYGLATMDARDDPTLRAGDLVATPGGLVKSVALSKPAQRNRGDDEIVTSSLPLGLRGKVSDGITLRRGGPNDLLQRTKPLTVPAR